MWVILLPLGKGAKFNLLAVGESQDREVEEWRKRSDEAIEVSLESRVNFTEAALINYFKPKYNGENFKANFPSREHVSYGQWFTAPVDFATLELQSFESIGCRTFSSAVKPSFSHFKTFQLNSSIDRRRFF